jgi:hypothetical protein
MKRLAILLALFASPAFAETVRFSASDVTIRATSQPGAAAEILYENSVHDSVKVGKLALTFGEIVCEAEIYTGYAEPDTIIVDCMGGYVAVPRDLTLADGLSGHVYVYPPGATGM